MNGGKEARAAHRAEVERAIVRLDAVRDGFEGNSKPLSYSKVQYGDYIAGLALPEAQRGQFYAGLLDFYFTGVEPKQFNKQQQLVFAGISPRVLNARAQALSKSGADLPKIWVERETESTANIEAKSVPNLTHPHGTVPAISNDDGAHLSGYEGGEAGGSLGGDALAITTSYEPSAIANEAIADMPRSNEPSPNGAHDPVPSGLYLTDVPLSLGKTLAPCPECGEQLPMFADGRGCPILECPKCGYRTLELPKGFEIYELMEGSRSFVLRKKTA